MEKILTDGQCLLPNTVLPSKFDGLNFDSLAGKHQNRQNFPLQNFPLYGNYSTDMMYS